MEVTASSFEDTFCGFLTMTHEIDSLANLGALIDVNGPFVNCGICSQGPDGEMGAWWYENTHSYFHNTFSLQMLLIMSPPRAAFGGPSAPARSFRGPEHIK